MANAGGSQSGKPWPRLTELYSPARGENSCQTVGLSNPLRREETWNEKAAAVGALDIVLFRCLEEEMKLKAIVFIGCYLYFPDLWYDS